MSQAPQKDDIIQLGEAELGVGAEPRQFVIVDDPKEFEGGVSVKAQDLENGGFSWDLLRVRFNYESAGGFYDRKQLSPDSYRRSRAGKTSAS